MRSSTRSRVVRLLRHAEHRNRASRTGQDQDGRAQRASGAVGSICDTASGSRSDAPVSASKKWNREGSTARRIESADARGRSRIDARIEQRAAIGDEVGAVVLVLLERLDRDARRVDAEEDVRIGAELLEHDDLDVDRRQLGRRERRVLERLRPDAEDHAARVERPGGRRAGSSGTRN